MENNVMAMDDKVSLKNLIEGGPHTINSTDEMERLDIYQNKSREMFCQLDPSSKKIKIMGPDEDHAVNSKNFKSVYSCLPMEKSQIDESGKHLKIRNKDVDFCESEIDMNKTDYFCKLDMAAKVITESIMKGEKAEFASVLDLAAKAIGTSTKLNIVDNNVTKKPNMVSYTDGFLNMEGFEASNAKPFKMKMNEVGSYNEITKGAKNIGGTSLLTMSANMLGNQGNKVKGTSLLNMDAILASKKGKINLENAKEDKTCKASEKVKGTSLLNMDAILASKNGKVNLDQPREDKTCKASEKVKGTSLLNIAAVLASRQAKINKDSSGANECDKSKNTFNSQKEASKPNAGVQKPGGISLLNNQLKTKLSVVKMTDEKGVDVSKIKPALTKIDEPSKVISAVKKDIRANNAETLGNSCDDHSNKDLYVYKVGGEIKVKMVENQKRSLLTSSVMDEIIKNKKIKSDIPVNETSISSEVDHRCVFCARGFETAEELKKHVAEHSKDLYQCYVCKARFLLDEDLKEHFMTHTTNKPYECDICEKQFTSNSGLNMHKLIHTGDKPHPCEICGKEFTRATVLRRHQRVHTGEKPFRCEQCGNHYANAFSLSQHKLIHTGERPHKCEECGKEFRLSNGLRRHMLLHTGEKPHQCFVCGRNFRQSTQLKNHKCINVHNAMELFECCHCGEKFSESSGLYTHMASHSIV